MREGTTTHKMIPRETNFASKQESSSNNADDAKTATTSWSRLNDPRIVRVSRAFGGKDRHSKVCTVRGLRDRRVRLSVPTAIQLYDLQERLGLNQPSKVVDWLLDAAKHEIDELPPLQIPQGIMLSPHHHFAAPQSDTNKQGGKFKDASGETSEDQNHQFDLDFLSRQQNPSSFSSLMMSSNSSFGRWDPSSLSLSHTPISRGLDAHQHEDLHSFSGVYQSGNMITQPYFTPQIAPANAAFDHPTARPFSFNMAADNAGNEQSKRDHLHSS